MCFQPLELVGHSHALSSLCFGLHNLNTLLCSCAEDYIIVWNIQQVQAAVADGTTTTESTTVVTK